MKFSVKEAIYEAVKGIKWNFLGILDVDKKLHQIPKNLNFQALFEGLVTEKLTENLARDHGIKVISPGEIRAYPDLILEGGKLGDRTIAVDVKTGRRMGNQTHFTLGSYAGYFKSPDQKMAGCVRPYNSFSEHWAVCFIYDWHPDRGSLSMISNIQTVVQEKWKLASKRTGTGTTTAIGSIRQIARIVEGKGDFKREREFLDYWMSYSKSDKK